MSQCFHLSLAPSPSQHNEVLVRRRRRPGPRAPPWSLGNREDLVGSIPAWALHEGLVSFSPDSEFRLGRLQRDWPHGHLGEGIAGGGILGTIKGPRKLGWDSWKWKRLKVAMREGELKKPHLDPGKTRTQEELRRP